MNRSPLAALGLLAALGVSPAASQAVDRYPAFTAIHGGAFNAGTSSMCLVATEAPDTFEILTFTCTAITPTLTGSWLSLGFALVDSEQPLGELWDLNSETHLPAPPVGPSHVALHAAFSAISAKVVLHDRSAHFFSGVVAATTVSFDSSHCSPILFCMPMNKHETLSEAGEDAARLAAALSLSTPSIAEGQGDPLDESLACFEAAATDADCAACCVKCDQGASRRERLCKAACPLLSVEAIFAGAGACATIGGCAAGPGGLVIGGCVGAIGGGVLARFSCLQTCGEVRHAEVMECFNALLPCLDSH